KMKNIFEKMPAQGGSAFGGKVLICTGIYPPDIGGPATYSKLLYDEMPKHGISIKILSFGKVRRLPKVIRHIVYFFKILLKSRDIDVIYAQDPVSVGLPSVLAAKILRKKFILKVVGDYAWEQFQNQISNLKSQKFITLEEFQEGKYNFMTELRRNIERWVAKNADKIIVPSGYLKKVVTKWGIDKKNIIVIYNAFDAQGLKMTKRESRDELNLSGTILISSGRLVPWKGFGALIDIMPEVLKEIPDARLYIIGSGLEEKNLKSQISNLKIGDNVFLVGGISREKLLTYLRACDIFVLNSGYEGFSHLILEAMALGVPVIASNIGGNTEIIRDGENGILIEYNAKEDLKNKIISLYNEEFFREKLIKNAKESVKKFSKEKMINDTIKILS
ncbi:MAG: glycosyltransferase family 4 protein, partial [Patescibacteria group bacterium]